MVSTALVGVVVDESGSDEVAASSVRVAVWLLVDRSDAKEAENVQVDLDGSGRSHGGQGGEREKTGELHVEVWSVLVCGLEKLLLLLWLLSVSLRGDDSDKETASRGSLYL